MDAIDTTALPSDGAIIAYPYIALVIIVLDKGPDRFFQGSGRLIGQRLVSTFTILDLPPNALGPTFQVDDFPFKTSHLEP
jgi:hypothetical protein